MIFDCFIFFNEIEMLKYRLELLGDYVDWFVIVESKFSFTGINKSLYFKQEMLNNDCILQKWKHKIFYVIVDDFPKNNNAWENEYFQRNCIIHGLNKLNYSNNDICILSDVDEIPNINVIKKFNLKHNTIYSLSQDFYYYNKNTRVLQPWLYPKMFKGFINNTDLNSIRWSKVGDIIHNAGWHLSYFGDTSFIKTKIESFSHQEYNIPSVIDSIESNVNNKQDLFGRNIKILHISRPDLVIIPIPNV
jgi:hypothetical protein